MKACSLQTHTHTSFFLFYSLTQGKVIASLLPVSLLFILNDLISWINLVRGGGMESVKGTILIKSPIPENSIKEI